MEPLGPGDPRQLGAYRLHARLGAGGMGQVFLGYSPAGRAVAVKVIHSDLAREPHFRARFRREVAAAAAVSGAYTAPVTAAGPDDNPPWLATAFVAGPSLDDAVEAAGPLPALSVWKLAAGLAEALQAVHACGLIHRDLKPSNVLLADDGPRVIDFGISHARESTVMTSAGQLMGTPGFMSPEQAQGERAGADSDIFSLGCIIAYAATGQPPFGGSDGGLHATVLYRVVHGEPALEGMPDGLRKLALACLAKEPASRPTLTALVTGISAARPPDHGTVLETFWPANVTMLIRSHQQQVSAQIRATRQGAPAGPPPVPNPVPPVPDPVPPAPAASPAPTTAPPPDEAMTPRAAGAARAGRPAPAPTTRPARAEEPHPVPGPAGTTAPAVASGPASFEPTSFEPASFEPASFEPASGQPAAAQSRRTEPMPARPGGPATPGGAARPGVSRRVALSGLAAAVAAGLAAGGWELTRLGHESPAALGDGARGRLAQPAGSAGSGAAGRPGTAAWSSAMSGPVTSLALVGSMVVTSASSTDSIKATEARKAGTGTVAWSAPGTGPYGLAPGVIYIGDASSSLSAQASADGSVIWGTPVGPGAIAGITAAARAVYVSTGDGALNALGAAHGHLLWTASTGPAKIVADARAVYAVAGGGVVSAHQVGNGALLWQAGGEAEDDGGRGRGGPGSGRGPGPGEGSGDGSGDGSGRDDDDNEDGDGPFAIAVAGSVVYVADGATVSARRASDGTLIWTSAVGSPVTSGIAVDGQAVYVGTGGGSVLALAIGGGSRIWSFAAAGPVASGIAADGSAVYFGTSARTIEAVTAGAGIRRWRFTADAPIQSEVTVGGGLVYAGSSGSTVYALHI